MSHFTSMKTSFQNLFYLEKALNHLEIKYKRKNVIDNSLEKNRYNINLTIPQLEDSDIIFYWDGEEYKLVVDKSFWKQGSSLESFIDKITQQYAGELIISEGQKTGFQPVKYKQNNDGSNTLILERWNSKYHFNQG